MAIPRSHKPHDNLFSGRNYEITFLLGYRHRRCPRGCCNRPSKWLLREFHLSLAPFPSPRPYPSFLNPLEWWPPPVVALKKHFAPFPKRINNVRAVETPSHSSPRNFRIDNGSLTRIIDASTAFDPRVCIPALYRSKSTYMFPESINLAIDFSYNKIFVQRK